MVSKADKLGGLIFGALLLAACGGKSTPQAEVPSAPDSTGATEGSCGGKAEGSCEGKKEEKKDMAPAEVARAEASSLLNTHAQ